MALNCRQIIMNRQAGAKVDKSPKCCAVYKMKGDSEGAVSVLIDGNVKGFMVGGSFEIAGVVFGCYFACVVVVGKTVALFDWPR